MRLPRSIIVSAVALTLGVVGTTSWLGHEARQARLNQQLITAVDNGNVAVVRSLLAQGAAPNTHEDAKPPPPWAIRFFDSLLHHPVPQADTGEPLLNVVLYGSCKNNAIATDLINHEADVNSQDDSVPGNRDTALMWAASDGDVTIVQMLLAHGADVHRRDANAETALAKAIFMGNYRTARLLLARGAQAADKDGQGMPLLLETVKLGKGTPEEAALVRDLITDGADVNGRDTVGSTALMWTSMDGQTEVARVLLAHGANVNLADNTHETALMQAAADGAVPIVRLLLAHGANLEAKDGDGDTALQYPPLLTQWDKSPGARRRQAETEHVLRQALAMQKRSHATTR